MWTAAAREAAIAARQANAKGRQAQGARAGAHARAIVNLPGRRANAGIGAGRMVAGAVLGAMAGATSAIVKPALSNMGGMGGGMRRGRR